MVRYARIMTHPVCCVGRESVQAWARQAAERDEAHPAPRRGDRGVADGSITGGESVAERSTLGQAVTCFRDARGAARTARGGL